MYRCLSLQTERSYVNEDWQSRYLGGTCNGKHSQQMTKSVQHLSSFTKNSLVVDMIGGTKLGVNIYNVSQ